MAECKHENVVVNPGKIEREGDGFIVGDLFGGTMYCHECNEPLPIEDLVQYDREHTSVAIPADLVESKGKD